MSAVDKRRKKKQQLIVSTSTPWDPSWLMILSQGRTFFLLILVMICGFLPNDPVLIRSVDRCVFCSLAVRPLVPSRDRTTTNSPFSRHDSLTLVDPAVALSHRALNSGFSRDRPTVPLSPSRWRVRSIPTARRAFSPRMTRSRPHGTRWTRPPKSALNSFTILPYPSMIR